MVEYIMQKYQKKANLYKYLFMYVCMPESNHVYQTLHE